MENKIMEGTTTDGTIELNQTVSDKKGHANSSLILGIVGVIAWLIPLFGLPVTITGLVFGIKGRKSTRRSMALAGIILCSIFLVLTLINAGVGIYLAITGKLGWLN